MAAIPKVYYTPAEYLALERRAETKSEYWDGEIYAMSGASREHNLIAGNIATSLNIQLRERPCEVYPSDMKVRIPNTRRYFYPDVSVACGELRFEDDYTDVLLNPTVIVEVLSDSTESFDRVKKFDSYRKIDELQEYVLVAQDEYKVHIYTRQPDGRWLFSEITHMDDSLSLASIGCKLVLADIYNKVQFNT